MYTGLLEFSFKGQEFKVTFNSMSKLAAIWIVIDEKPEIYIADFHTSDGDTPEIIVKRAVTELQTTVAENRIAHVLQHGGYKRNDPADRAGAETEAT